jgi:hypothetical protein
MRGIKLLNTRRFAFNTTQPKALSTTCVYVIDIIVYCDRGMVKRKERESIPNVYMTPTTCHYSSITAHILAGWQE